MSDSIDRVFGHALRSVSRIGNSGGKPPPADRLALYGLYKQSCEGDVYTTTRPTGTSESAGKEQEKWDAWDANRGLSRTEAKKRYIEKLISTMHEYASSTPEARELVGELEFVWDQVKGNSNSDSSGSSPGRGLGQAPTGMTADGMRVLRPASEGEVEDEPEGEEEFVDAPDSQFGLQEGSPEDKSVAEDGERSRPRRVPVADVRWRKRVESAIVKMTTEVAALRELVESRRYVQRRRFSILGGVLSVGWFLVKLALVDALALWLVILYLRRKKDRRLEGAVRVMLGDAQAVAKNLATQVQSKLPTRKQ